MPRTFLTITQDEIDLKIAEGIRSRELELLAYDFEQASHEAVIAAAKSKAWDTTTEKYKGLTRDQIIKAVQGDGGDAATLASVSELATADRSKQEVEAVKIELMKSEKHYDNLLAQLPVERRDAAFAALSAKEAGK